MSLANTIIAVTSDLLKGGPSFFVSGLCVAVSAKSEMTLKLKGVGKITVRPKNSDFSTFRQVFRDGDYQYGRGAIAERISAAYDAILAAGNVPVIVDAGANVGAATRWFAKKFDKALTIAIEPEPENARILRRNIEGIPQANLIEAAIGGESGFVSLKGMGWGAQTFREESGLPIVTVADVVASVPNGQLFIAKIDIEGFESDLFAGNTAWIDDAFVVYIEPHDWMLPGKRTSRNFQRELAKRDFELLIQGENLIYVR